MTNDYTNTNFEQEPTIERCPHDRENPYCMINNALIRDASLSPECRWLLIYLLSNKDGWKISVSQIIDHVQPHMGKAKVYNLFKQAIEAGYLKREEEQRINPRGGTLKCYRYLLSETPKFKKFYRYPENRDPGETDTGPIYKNNHSKKSLSKERDKEKRGDTPPKPPPPSRIEKSIQREEHVFTSEEEHKKLIQDYGEDLTMLAYQKLSLWKMDTPKSRWKKNDYRSILRWVLKALKEEKLKEEELCLKSQKMKEKSEKKDWKPESKSFNAIISEPVLKGQPSVKVESPYLEKVRKRLESGLPLDEISW